MKCFDGNHQLAGVIDPKELFGLRELQFVGFDPPGTYGNFRGSTDQMNVGDIFGFAEQDQFVPSGRQRPLCFIRELISGECEISLERQRVDCAHVAHPADRCIELITGDIDGG